MVTKGSETSARHSLSEREVSRQPGMRGTPLSRAFPLQTRPARQSLSRRPGYQIYCHGVTGPEFRSPSRDFVTAAKHVSGGAGHSDVLRGSRAPLPLSGRVCGKNRIYGVQYNPRSQAPTRGLGTKPPQIKGTSAKARSKGN